jgi:hypothetical protein
MVLLIFLMTMVTLMILNPIKTDSRQTSQLETALSAANPRLAKEYDQLEYVTLAPDNF